MAQRGQDISEAIKEAHRNIAERSARLETAMAAQQWGTVDEESARLLSLLREVSRLAPVTHSFLAAIYGRWGLAMEQQRRYKEAQEQLLAAEALFNMDPEAAVEWAAQQGINIEGEGEPLDLRLAQSVLETLGATMVRFGNPRAGEVLAQVVSVADLNQDEAAQWAARQHLAAYTAGLADWQGLLQIAREMGRIAQSRQSLPMLLEVMRLFVEAYIGLDRLYRALEGQQLVVDLARHLNHPDLAEEEAELKKLKEAEQR